MPKLPFNFFLFLFCCIPKQLYFSQLDALGATSKLFYMKVQKIDHKKI